MKFFLTYILLALALNSNAKNKVVVNPPYEVRTSGIYNISKIELSSKETRLFVHCKFKPNLWIRFLKSTFIENPDTGEKLFIKAMRGGEIDKQIYMPASGDSSFVLIFPAVKKATTKINFGEKDRTIIFGLSLDPKKQQSRSHEVPANVNAWLDAELAKSKNNTLVNYTSPQFFNTDTARVIGYIKGYDRRLGFSTGIVYASNEISNDDSPMVVSIEPDGRFQASIPMNYPRYHYLILKDNSVNYYLEPGQTLAIVLSWEELLTADHYNHKYKDIQFMGPAARINQELMSVSINPNDYQELEKYVKTQNPNDFKASQLAVLKNREEKLEHDLKGRDFTEQTKTILKNQILLSGASYHFDYVMRQQSEARNNPAFKASRVKPDSSFYDFLQRIPQNDQSLLISSHFSTFINRFEFSEPIMASKRNAPDNRRIPFEAYLFKELLLKPTKDDLSYIAATKELEKKFEAEIGQKEADELLKQHGLKADPFYKKYATQFELYKKKYPEKEELYPNSASMLREWDATNATLINSLKIQPGLIIEIAKVRTLKFLFDRVMKNDKDQARTFLTSLEKGIANAAVMQEAEIMFRKAYPLVPKAAYDLPRGKGTDIFKKIIDQYKGKIVFVDFWAIFCGPCIASIKANKDVREKYKGSKDLEFVFITSDSESPEPRYTDFVNENELVNTYRLSSDEYLYLRQLFKFNGIPRYIVINKEGQVLNDDFEMHNFKVEIEKLLAQSK
ncbi:MAG: redoxin family protein [Sphingobacteriaceae bacterium]|nr:redoxin family protein [Sphingobacteriaceae bacterium]